MVQQRRAVSRWRWLPPARCTSAHLNVDALAPGQRPRPRCSPSAGSQPAAVVRICSARPKLGVVGSKVSVLPLALVCCPVCCVPTCPCCWLKIWQPQRRGAADDQLRWLRWWWRLSYCVGRAGRSVMAGPELMQSSGHHSVATAKEDKGRYCQ